MQDEQRIVELLALQEKYKDDFIAFLEFAMGKLGFRTSEMQKDIAEFISDSKHGNWKMVQAPRGEAKTTIASIYAIYRLIMTPTIRISVITARADLAGDITKVIFDAVRNWDEIKCLAPDSRGRQSTEKFDVWYGFKGEDKQASVACSGIMAGQAGKRSDLIITDDIEDDRNSESEMLREKLWERFIGLADLANDGGDIVVLGTPQNRESIYNKLPDVGYKVRIWTGRLPTKEDIINYEGRLAPYIVNRINQATYIDYVYGLSGDLGKATDELLNPEHALIQKERLDRARFRLQYMLDTSLMDKDTYPLRLGDLLFTNIDIANGLQVTLQSSKNQASMVPRPRDWTIKETLYMADIIQGSSIPITRIVCAVDPAGGGANGDETGYAVVGQSGDRLIVLDVGGIKGGYNTESYEQLGTLLTKWSPNEVLIEKNYGNGAFKEVWQNKAMFEQFRAIPIVDVTNTTNKERRICDSLEPIINDKKLIFDLAIVENEYATAMAKDGNDRRTFSLFHQMSKMTRDKDCVKHDDRIDALAMAVDHLKGAMYTDRYAIEHAQIEQQEQDWFCTTYGFGSWQEYVNSYGVGSQGFEKHQHRLVLDRENSGEPVVEDRYSKEEQSFIGMIL